MAHALDLGVISAKAWHGLDQDSVTPRVYYAVVMSSGCYSQGSMVRALTVCRDYNRAKRIADKSTQQYRKAMQPYGGSSGYFRVVATEKTRATNCRWLGLDLDKLPSL